MMYQFRTAFADKFRDPDPGERIPVYAVDEVTVGLQGPRWLYVGDVDHVSSGGVVWIRLRRASMHP